MSTGDSSGHENKGRGVPAAVVALAIINELLLFAFFDSIEFLNNSFWLSGFKPGACILNKSDETLRQLANPFRLTPLNGLRGDEFGAHADGRGASQNEVGRRLLVHASRGNQGNLRQRSPQSFDVAVAANLRAGKNFDEVGTGSPGGNYLGRRQSARKNGDVFFGGELDDHLIESGAG